MFITPTNLAQVNRQINLAAERLTTGLRINRAADDVGGMAVSTRLTSEILARGQVTENVAQGAAVFDFHVAVIDDTLDILSRMEEIAEEGAAGGLSNAEYGALSQEYSELSDKVLPLLSGANMNGVSLFEDRDPSDPQGYTSFQVGPDADDRISYMHFDLRAASSNWWMEQPNSQPESQAALDMTRDAIANLTNERARLEGAKETLESRGEMSDKIKEALITARDKIVNADEAKEEANLAKYTALSDNITEMLSMIKSQQEQYLKLIESVQISN